MPERPLDPVRENRWLGMHADSNAKLPPGVVEYAQNFYLSDGAFRPRQGFYPLDDVDFTPLGGMVQGVVHFEELNGTLHTLLFANGNMHEWDWDTSSFVTTDLSVEGVAIDGSAHLDFANSRGRLIVTDGVNLPWMWDGESFTTLTEAPIAHGCVLYYDKVFFFDIPNNETSFQWSEEGDPETGYSALGNEWEFAQSDAGRIRGMAALNNALVVFKEDSTAQVRGAVIDQFQTDAVREGVSETEGSISRRSVVVLDGDVFWLSQNGPRAAAGGNQLLRINEDENRDDRLRDFWAEVDRSRWGESFGMVDTQRRHIWWFVPMKNQDNMRTALVYAVDEDAWQVFTLDSTFDISAMAEVEDLVGNEWLVIGRSDGHVLRNQEFFHDWGESVEYVLRSGQHGHQEPMIVKRLVEVRLHLELLTDSIEFRLRPYVDGRVANAPIKELTGSGEIVRYRKGTNRLGFTAGWEFYLNFVDQATVIHSAMTFMTLSGSHESA